MVDTSMSGQGNLSLCGGGAVSLAGEKALDLRFDGQLPFAILAGQLASQGFVLEGTGTVDLAIAGTAAAPAITGTAKSSSARPIDVRHNLAINDLAATDPFNADQPSLTSLTGNLSPGSSLDLAGTVRL